MDKKIVLLTGALSNHGKAITSKLIEKDYCIILNDENKDELEKYVTSLNNKDVYFVAGKAYEDDDVDQVFDYIQSHFNKLDVLINNYCEYKNKSFLEISIDEIKDSFKKNVISTMLNSQKASELMISNKIAGHIVNISSDHAFTADYHKFDESVIAWALRGTTRATAKQLSKQDIKVNAYCVNDIESEAVASLVAFLIDDNNMNITGQNIMLNDGIYMD